MFVSTPDFEFHVPKGLAPPGQTYWRSLGLATRAPWFILSVRLGGAAAAMDTYLLTWDTDLTDLLRQKGAEVQSLLLVVGDFGEGRGGCSSHDICEIWEAIDVDDHGNSCVLLVDRKGAEFSGYFMEQGRNIERKCLVASVYTAAGRNASPSS